MINAKEARDLRDTYSDFSEEIKIILEAIEVRIEKAAIAQDEHVNIELRISEKHPMIVGVISVLNKLGYATTTISSSTANILGISQKPILQIAWLKNGKAEDKELVFESDWNGFSDGNDGSDERGN